MSTQRPILLNDEMVRAILEGRKTQTRRIMKPQPVIDSNGWFRWDGHKPNSKFGAYASNRIDLQAISIFVGVSCPYGRPGDRLWVRETFSDVNLQGAPGIAYRADDDIRDLMAEPSFQDEDGAFNYNDERLKTYHFAVWSEDLLSGSEGRWRPSIHMPRWASRIMLEITDVRVERLQDISGEDSAAEGVTDPIGSPRAYGVVTKQFARDQFMRLWESINGPDSWQVNPWVWVVEFKRIDGGDQ